MIMDGSLVKLTANEVDLDKLSLPHVQGVFILLPEGIGLGLISLLCEVITVSEYVQKFENKIVDNWTIINFIEVFFTKATQNDTK